MLTIEDALCSLPTLQMQTAPVMNSALSTATLYCRLKTVTHNSAWPANGMIMAANLNWVRQKGASPRCGFDRGVGVFAAWTDDGYDHNQGVLPVTLATGVAGTFNAESRRWNGSPARVRTTSAEATTEFSEPQHVAGVGIE